MSLREELIDHITEALCERAKVQELPEKERDWMQAVIRSQSETAVTGFQIWLASDGLIDALHDDLVEHGFSKDQALGALYRVLSCIDKQAGG